MPEGLFQTFSNKLKLRCNEAIKLLQFCKLARKPDENAKEWMGRLRMPITECNYKEIVRQLKEQFILGSNNSAMSIKIIRELTKIEDNENITSEQVLAWAKRVEAQKTQSAILEQLKETKDFDRIFTSNKHKAKT